jgi:hypothetical protein
MQMRREDDDGESKVLGVHQVRYRANRSVGGSSALLGTILRNSRGWKLESIKLVVLLR